MRQERLSFGWMILPAVVSAAWLVFAVSAVAQSSSLLRMEQPSGPRPRGATSQPAATGGVSSSAGAIMPMEPDINVTLRMTSLIAVVPPEPQRYRLHDLVNIVVRHQLRYRADGRLEQNRITQFEAELSEWFRIHDQKYVAQDFQGGDPHVKFDLTDNRRSQGRNQRQDELTTRIEAEVIDVKPNGTLVIQARARYVHEEEDQTITLTGTCRGEDISADHSILSDKIANLEVVTSNEGSVRDTTKRGFLFKAFDAAKPF